MLHIVKMEKTYSVKEASKLLGYSTNSVYSFLKDGDIKSVRIGKGKFRIPQSEIDKFLGGTRMDEIATARSTEIRNDGGSGSPPTVTSGPLSRG